MFNAIVLTLLVAALIVPGLILLLNPVALLEAINGMALRAGSRMRLLSTELTWRMALAYRVAGAGFVAMSWFVVQSALITRDYARLAKQPRSHGMPSSSTASWPLLLLSGVGLLVMAMLVVNPRLAARMLQWDKYMDPDILHHPAFPAAARLAGGLGLILTLSALIRSLWPD